MLFTAATVMLKGTALGFVVGLGLAAVVGVASLPWEKASCKLYWPRRTSMAARQGRQRQRQQHEGRRQGADDEEYATLVGGGEGSLADDTDDDDRSHHQVDSPGNAGSQ